jgi:uncharacterized protein YqgV (UPF0045/DUF77 family)
MNTKVIQTIFFKQGGIKMPVMEIAISPWGTEGRPIMGDSVTYFVLLSKQKGVRCQLTSPTRVTIEGDRKTLLEILDEFDNTSFNTVAKRIAITL